MISVEKFKKKCIKRDKRVKPLVHMGETYHTSKKSVLNTSKKRVK